MLSTVEIRRAKLQAVHFVPHVKIQAAEGGPPIPFDLWDFQRDVIHDFETHDRVIVLKARQLGLSWLALADMLWLTSCNRGRTGLILNRGLRESIELLDRVRFMHKHLPIELRPRITKDVVDHLEFGDLGGRIFSLPASEFSGSGLTAHYVLVDEWAKIRSIRKILTSVLPTLSAGGKLAGISTAAGFHNPFAEEWRRAISKQSRYFPIFIPWDAHPDRDAAWYEDKRRELPTERDLLQEYPAEWLDAFQLPGESVFRDEFDIRRHVVEFELDPKATWPKYRGIDFGYHHGIVLWASIEQERSINVFAELHAQRTTTQAMMERAILIDAEYEVDTSSTAAGADPAGKAQTSVATESDHFTVERCGMRVEAAEVAPRDRVTLIKQLLKEDRLKIHPRCKFLIEALSQAQWAKQGAPMGNPGAEPIPKETYEKDGYYEHPLDALGYLVINVFPSMGAPATARSARPSGGGAGGTRRYSQSEYG